METGSVAQRGCGVGRSLCGNDGDVAEVCAMVVAGCSKATNRITGIDTRRGTCTGLQPQCLWNECVCARGDECGVDRDESSLFRF